MKKWNWSLIAAWVASISLSIMAITGIITAINTSNPTTVVIENKDKEN